MSKKASQLDKGKGKKRSEKVTPEVAKGDKKEEKQHENEDDEDAPEPPPSYAGLSTSFDQLRTLPINRPFDLGHELSSYVSNPSARTTLYEALAAISEGRGHSSIIWCKETKQFMISLGATWGSCKDEWHGSRGDRDDRDDDRSGSGGPAILAADAAKKIPKKTRSPVLDTPEPLSYLAIPAPPITAYAVTGAAPARSPPTSTETTSAGTTSLTPAAPSTATAPETPLDTKRSSGVPNVELAMATQLRDLGEGKVTEIYAETKRKFKIPGHENVEKFVWDHINGFWNEVLVGMQQRKKQTENKRKVNKWNAFVSTMARVAHERGEKGFPPRSKALSYWYQLFRDFLPACGEKEETEKEET